MPKTAILRQAHCAPCLIVRQQAAAMKSGLSMHSSTALSCGDGADAHDWWLVTSTPLPPLIPNPPNPCHLVGGRGRIVDGSPQLGSVWVVLSDEFSFSWTSEVYLHTIIPGDPHQALPPDIIDQAFHWVACNTATPNLSMQQQQNDMLRE